MAKNAAANNNKKLQKSYFDVLGICCSSEVPMVETILKHLDGVKDVSVIVPTKTVIVTHDSLLVSQLQIVKALNQARLEANIRVYGDDSFQRKWPSKYSIICGVLLLLSFLKPVFHPFQWLALVAVAIGIVPIAQKGFVSVCKLRLDINVLVIVAVAGSIALKDYWEAATIVFLFTIAEWLQSIASHKAKAVMSSLVNMVPQRAVLAETGEEVNVSEVKVSTILAVKAGETIPIDGVVVDGKCEVDEKALTGESFPVAKQEESTVWAGTINLNGYISVKTTALAEECVVARMTKLVEESQNNKSKTQRIIDICASYCTPAVVIASASLAAIPFALNVPNKKVWCHKALVVLVSACPCALVISTPVATFCSLSKAAMSGVLIKGADFLETMAKVKTIAFDKTGTITRGEFVVTDFQPLLEDVSLDTLLYWVSSIESKSSHPMAAALVEYGKSLSVEPMADKVEEFQNFPGEGIYGKIDGKNIYIGNQRIATKAGCATVSSLNVDTKQGKTSGYIFLESTPAGTFSLLDVCRTGVKEALQELKRMGIKTAMLTGDCHAAAMYAQNQLGGGLDVIHAEVLPEDKARIIKEFQKEAPTAMIGDGLNDALALATADIGISMGISGSALATETGNVILMSNDIRKVPIVVQLARRTRRKIIENMILSVTTKVAVIALAFAVRPLVWAAVLADVGTCLLVILNSMLLLGKTRTFGGNHCKNASSSSHAHKHKHGCKREGGEHSSNHSHHHSCSSDNVAPNKCKPSKCSSKKHADCENRKCTDTTSEHYRHHNQEARHSDHGSCNMESRSVHNHDCGNNHKLNSRSHSEEKHCDHGSKDVCDHGSKDVHSSIDHSVGSAKLHQHSDSHCQSKHCRNNRPKNSVDDDKEAGDKIEKTCSQHYSSSSLGIHLGCKKHGSDEHGSPHHSAMNDNISSSGNHVECTAIRTTCLEKRHIGGCCESFRKECCGSHGHFGASLRGGLSEIIIE